MKIYNSDLRREIDVQFIEFKDGKVVRIIERDTIEPITVGRLSGKLEYTEEGSELDPFTELDCSEGLTGNELLYEHYKNLINQKAGKMVDKGQEYLSGLYDGFEAFFRIIKDELK